MMGDENYNKLLTEVDDKVKGVITDSTKEYGNARDAAEYKWKEFKDVIVSAGYQSGLAITDYVTTTSNAVTSSGLPVYTAKSEKALKNLTKEVNKRYTAYQPLISIVNSYMISDAEKRQILSAYGVNFLDIYAAVHNPSYDWGIGGNPLDSGRSIT